MDARTLCSFQVHNLTKSLSLNEVLLDCSGWVLVLRNVFFIGLANCHPQTPSRLNWGWLTQWTDFLRKKRWGCQTTPEVWCISCLLDMLAWEFGCQKDSLEILVTDLMIFYNIYNVKNVILYTVYLITYTIGFASFNWLCLYLVNG